MLTLNFKDGRELIINYNGTKRWYHNGKLHREDGPALDADDGAKYWFQHGKLHRLDGPAVECSDIRLWYQNGVVLNSEFIRMNDS